MSRHRFSPPEVALVVLEVLLAGCALIGGTLLVLHPRGADGFSASSTLVGTPFHTFLIPGIALLLLNGVVPLLVAAAALLHHPAAGVGHVAVGSVLVTWIAAQVLMVGFQSFLQPVFFGYGLLVLALALHEWSRSHGSTGTPTEPP